MKQLFKVVIVDDEPWIAQSLGSILEWEKEEFQVAGIYTDPLDALSNIREVEPDLILLDIRMPQMSGEKIMEQIRADGLACQFIVVSAYSDFSVAQHAISLGAVGYVLKPVAQEELLQAVRRTKKILLRNRASEPCNPNQQEEILKLALGNPKKTLPNGYYVMVSDSGEKQLEFPDKNGAFSPQIRIYGNRSLWLFMPDAGEEPPWGELRQLCKNQGCALGCSSHCTDSGGYPARYQQAACALFGTQLFQKKECAVYQPADAEFIREWSDALLAVQQKEELYEKLQSLSACWSEGVNPATVVLLVTELSCWVLFRQGEEEKTAAQDGLALQDFYSFQSLSDVMRYLENILVYRDYQAAKDLVDTSGMGLKIRKYIDSHYREHLSLTELSHEFYLSSSYISDAFKKSNGYTITAYIAKVRMEKAARMLRETDWSLVKIADEAGYDDYNYFCRLFKRYYRVAPNAYRHKTRAV